MAKNLADIALEKTNNSLHPINYQPIDDINLLDQHTEDSKRQFVASPTEVQDPNTPAPAKPHVADAGELAKAMAEADVKKGILKAPETEEEKQAREKKENRNKWLARISDAVSAASNLVTASQGGVSVFNPENSMSKRWSDAYEKQKAEREKNNQMYFNAYNNYMKMAQDNIDNLREYQRKVANDAREQQKYDDEYKLKQIQSALNAQLMAGKISEQQYKTQIAAINAKYTEPKNQANINRTNAQTSHYYTMGTGRKVTTGGSGDNEYASYIDKNGTEHRFSKKDYGAEYKNVANAAWAKDNPNEAINADNQAKQTMARNNSNAVNRGNSSTSNKNDYSQYKTSGSKRQSAVKSNNQKKRTVKLDH